MRTRDIADPYTDCTLVKKVKIAPSKAMEALDLHDLPLKHQQSLVDHQMPFNEINTEVNTPSSTMTQLRLPFGK
jgi:hypothetical protein